MVAIKLSHFIITPKPYMAAKSRRSRVPVLTDIGELHNLVKNHITKDKDPVAHPALWRRKDIDFVVGHYQDFLAAISEKGHYLRKNELGWVLWKHFGGDQILMKQCAGVIDGALKYCKSKSIQIRSGAKTCGPVLRIARIWAKHASSQTLATTSAASSDLPVEEISTSNAQHLAELLAAQKALVEARNMFASGETRALKRRISIASEASSEGEHFGEGAPKASKPSTTEAAKASKLQRTATPKASKHTIYEKKQYD